jgi:hypothetical protein
MERASALIKRLADERVPWVKPFHRQRNCRIGPAFGGKLPHGTPFRQKPSQVRNQHLNAAAASAD